MSTWGWAMAGHVELSFQKLVWGRNNEKQTSWADAVYEHLPEVAVF